MSKLRLNDELSGETEIWTVVCWFKSLSLMLLFSSEIMGRENWEERRRGVLGKCLLLQMLVCWGCRVAVLSLEYTNPSWGLRHPWIGSICVQFSGKFFKRAYVVLKNQLRKQTMGWRRAVVTRVWPNAGRDSTIKYHPVERDVVLLPKASLRTWNNHWGEREERGGEN